MKVIRKLKAFVYLRNLTDLLLKTQLNVLVVSQMTTLVFINKVPCVSIKSQRFCV